MSVYDCIVAVSRDIATAGISKSRNNAQQGYKFRGIDDVYNALAPLLAKHGLVILPRVLSRSVIERATKNGGALFYVTVEAEYQFVSAADGSTHTVKTYGEAMDSADKATNKAMSAAYKYAALQTFCIPTEGDNDADNSTPEVAAGTVTTAPPAMRVDREAGRQLPPGFAPIHDVKQDGAFLQVFWGSDGMGAPLMLRTKVPHIQSAALEAFEDRVPVRLMSKDAKYLDKVERLDSVEAA
jgi:hypothetical protein